MNPENQDSPHDKKAERVVLGAMLINTEVIPFVMSILGETPDTFLHE